jgi:predicted RNA polymerase sigma factor
VLPGEFDPFAIQQEPWHGSCRQSRIPPVNNNTAEPTSEMVEALYRAESRRVLATLIRLLGDFELAEEALHDAFRAALEQWPRDGMPANPRAWLVSAGRFKAIDGIRRRARFEALDDEAAEKIAAPDDPATWGREDIEDDRLRLMFTCCHPRGVRPHDRGNRARLPHRAGDAGAAHRARQDQDPRRAHSL